MPAPIRIALIGLGKIARDQHVPALAADPGFALVAAADPHATALPSVPHFADIAALRGSGIMVDAVTIATPPGVRAAIAADALAIGWHICLEKPPAATLAQAAALRPQPGKSLFFAWHSRFAPAVAPLRAVLAADAPRRIAIIWHEDWRVWHPGQDWIWRADGLGVFDAGINALSILTALLPGVVLQSSALAIPQGRAAPIAARLALSEPGGCAITADLDWRITGPPRWEMVCDLASGRRITLCDGGARLDGQAMVAEGEYPALYRHFASLIASGQSDTDDAPLALVAAALASGTVQITEAL